MKRWLFALALIQKSTQNGPADYATQSPAAAAYQQALKKLFTHRNTKHD